MAGDRVADDAEKFGALLVAGTLREVVAARAAARHGGALFGIGAGQQRPDIDSGHLHGSVRRPGLRQFVTRADGLGA